MSDDRKLPPVPRPGTHRDMYTPKHGTRIPVEVPQEVTGQYEGEELAQIRARRPTDKRIARLEEKHDELKSDVKETKTDVKALTTAVNQLAVAVADQGGQLKVLPELVEAVNNSITRAAARDHVTFTAQVDVDKANALDRIDAKKSRRGLITTIAGGLFSAGVVGAAISLLAQRC